MASRGQEQASLNEGLRKFKFQVYSVFGED
jgi:hypothetical protein